MDGALGHRHDDLFALQGGVQRRVELVYDTPSLDVMGNPAADAKDKR
jgi:hypothetical protein